MLSDLNIRSVQEGIRNKKFTYLDLVIEQEKHFNNNKLNVAITSYWDQAKEQAKNLVYDDNKPLNGISIGVKDMFLVKDTKTTAASAVLDKFTAPYESHITQLLKNNNYIMPFKTNLDEFAMGSSNLTSYYGAVVNPWILKDRVLRVPGGSSGGSAAAVAAYMCHGALGTDTGGSIRQPAAYCGIVGFKPSYGRCSRRGVIAFASSLDHPGVFARNVEDACVLLDNIAGYDPLDCTSLNEKMKKLSIIDSNVKNKTLGVPYKILDILGEEYKKQILSVIHNLKAEGVNVIDIDLPYCELALDLYLIISRAEACSNLARYDGLRFGTKNGNTFEEILKNSRNLFGNEVKRRILLGNFVLNADYNEYMGKATNARNTIIQYMHVLFSKVDAILLPTTMGAAFGINEELTTLQMHYEDMFTVLANMYKGPALQLPIGKINNPKNTVEKNEYDFLKTQDGLPIGIQILAAYKMEENIIPFAKKIEEQVAWKGLSL